MSLRDDAMDDILAATSSDVLGQDITLDGEPLSVTLKSLTAKEVSGHGFDGLAMEGIRLTLQVSDLPAVPVYGQQVEVDGSAWDTKLTSVNGNRLRLTLMRYIS